MNIRTIIIGTILMVLLGIAFMVLTTRRNTYDFGDDYIRTEAEYVNEATESPLNN